MQIETTEVISAHLGGVARALYESLGEVAGSMTNDAATIGAYEGSRHVGEVAHRFDALGANRRGTDPHAHDVDCSTVRDVIQRSVALDPSGALSLYCAALQITPRLLISLRDASGAATGLGDGALVSACRQASATLIEVSRRWGVIASQHVDPETAEFAEGARTLDGLLSAAGFAESFGTGG